MEELLVFFSFSFSFFFFFFFDARDPHLFPFFFKVMERYNSQKTIPVASLGGRAGGEKYIGFFLKLYFIFVELFLIFFIFLVQ